MVSFPAELDERSDGQRGEATVLGVKWFATVVDP